MKNNIFTQHSLLKTEVSYRLTSNVRFIFLLFLISFVCTSHAATIYVSAKNLFENNWDNSTSSIKIDIRLSKTSYIYNKDMTKTSYTYYGYPVYSYTFTEQDGGAEIRFKHYKNGEWNQDYNAQSGNWESGWTQSSIYNNKLYLGYNGSNHVWITPSYDSNTAVTLYYVVPTSYSVKCNRRYFDDIDKWEQLDMTKTGYTYNGTPIYKVSFTDIRSGSQIMQFQQYDNSIWKSQVVAINNTWTSSSVYNNKMYVNNQWLDYIYDVKVTFNLQGHGNTIPAITLLKGNKATKPTDPTASGWTFEGWYTDQQYTKPFDFNTAITEDITLYAKWTLIQTEKPTLKVSAGEGIKSVSGSQEDVTLGETYDIAAAAAGYSFAGWTANPTENAEFITDPSQPKTKVMVKNGSVIVTATATENLYSITATNSYDKGNPGYTAPTITNTTNNKIGIKSTATLTATTAGSGYKFKGWTLTNCVITSGSTTSQTITVKYDTDKGNGDAKATANYTEDRSTEWYIAGTWNNKGDHDTGWEQNGDSKQLLKKSGATTSDLCYLTVTLDPLNYTNSKLSFKVTNFTDWYGNNGTFNQQYNQDWEFSTSGVSNATMDIPYRGEYTFVWNPTNKTLSINYPSPANLNYLRGGFNGWGWDNPLTKTSTGYEIEYEITEEDHLYSGDYGFKMLVEGIYYGKNKTIVSARNNNISSLADNDDNMGLATTIAGKYKFDFNTSSKQLVVTYPNILEPTGKLTLKGEGKDNNIFDGKGTEESPLLVKYNTELTVKATHNDADNTGSFPSHLWYTINGNTKKSTATDATTNKLTAEKKTATPVEASAFYRYGPDSYTADGKPLNATPLYYQAVCAVTFIGDNTNYKLTSKPKYAKYGEKVTFEAILTDGYVLNIKTAQENISFSRNGNEYSFTVPSDALYNEVQITIEAVKPSVNLNATSTSTLGANFCIDHEITVTPTLNFSPTGTLSYCYTLTDKDGKSVDYDEDKDGVLTFTPKTAGKYTVTLNIYEGKDNCQSNGKLLCSATKEIEVTEHFANITATYQKDGQTEEAKSVSKGTEVTLTASSSLDGKAGTTYTFTVQLQGGNLVTFASGTAKSVTYNNLQAVGTYTFTVIATNGDQTVRNSCEVKVTPETYHIRYTFNPQYTADNGWESKDMSYDTDQRLYVYYDANYSRYYTEQKKATVYTGDYKYGQSPDYDIENTTGITDGTIVVYFFDASVGRLWIETPNTQYYRIRSTVVDKDGNKKTYYSNQIKDKNEQLSFFAAASTDGGSLQWEKSTNGGMKWEMGPNITTKPSTSGVYTTTATSLDAAELTLTAYTGDYYIFSDNSGYNIANDGKDNKDGYSMKMTYFTNINDEEFYNYYWCHWVKISEDGVTSKDFYATVGNEINSNLANAQTEYLVYSQYTDPDDTNNEKERKGVSVRYAYNPATNYFSRTFLSGSQDSQYFVTIYDANNINSDGNNIKGNTEAITPENQQKFNDISDFQYMTTVKVRLTGSEGKRVPADIILASRFNGEYSYLLDQDGMARFHTIMGPRTSNITKADTEESLTELTFSVHYDFKTNRVLAAWTPDPTVTIESATIDADLLVTRNSLSGMNDNNLYNAGSTPRICGLAENAEIKVLGRVYFALELNRDEIFDTNDNPRNELQSRLFQFCLPYNMPINNIYGLENYGKDWNIQTYAGDLRALFGWEQRFDTWWYDLAWSDRNLTAGTGYVLQHNLERKDFGEIQIKVNNETVTYSRRYIYFPFPEKEDNSKTTNFDEKNCYIINKHIGETELKEYLCKVTGRKTEDSNWRCVGVPSFYSSKVATAKPETTDGKYTEEEVEDGETKYKWIFEWNGTKNNYTPKDATATDWQPSYHYLMQYAGTLTWTTDYNKANNVIAARRYAQDDTRTLCTIQLLDEDGEMSDQVFVGIDPNANVDYVLNEDVSKPFTLTVPQIYSHSLGHDLAANILPDTVSSAPLCTSLPQEGLFTITMAKKDGNATVYLYDRLLNHYTALDNDDYTFTGDAGQTTDRFSLIFKLKNAPTSLNNAYAGELKAEVLNGKIIISGTSANEAVMYDAAGKMMYSGSLDATNSLPCPATQGVYIIRAGEQSTRVIVK